MTIKERARKLKTDIPALWLAMKHECTPWYAKAVGGLALVYALSPIDLIPDFIPFFGMLDDLLILPGLIALTVKWIPSAVMEECREIVKNNASMPKKRFVYAIPFVIIWGLALAWIVSLFVS